MPDAIRFLFQRNKSPWFGWWHRRYPRTSSTALAQWGAKIGQQGGVYFLIKGLRTVLVAVHQLPLVPETLWLRILGKGQVQGQAVQELLALPESSPERSQVLRLVKNWQVRVEQNQEPEEAEMAVQLSQAYLEWERVTKETSRLEGKLEGELIGEQRAKLEAVPPLLQRGFSVDEIASILNLTVEQVANVLP